MKRYRIRLVTILGAAALAVLALAGCRGVSSPDRTVVSGTVHYPGGQPVHRAKVTAETGETTFTDARGQYQLAIRSDRRTATSITLTARDGYTPGVVYAVTRSGTVLVPLASGRVTRNIALTEQNIF
jgi:hypothetical protein